MFLVYSSAAGANPKLFWSGDFFNGGQPTYLEVTKPASFSGVVTGYQAIQDGSIASFQAGQEIWKTTDVGNATPTWTKILTLNSTACLGGVVTACGRMRVVGSRLYAEGSTGTKYWHGYYELAAWTFTEVLFFENMDLGEGPYAGFYWAYDTLPIKLRTADADGAPIIDTYNNVVENHTSWRKQVGGDIKRFAENSGSWYIRNCTTQTNIFATVNPVGSVLKGALHGDQLCFPDGNGVARVADDGATFAARSTWQAGTILPAQLAGGDTLVWLGKQTGGNKVFSRL